MKKKAVFPHCFCYIRKNWLPKEKPSIAKKEKQFLIKALSFSRVLRSHTPFYCLLDFHSSPSQNHHPHSSRAKTSGRIVERKTKERNFFGLLRYRFMDAAVKERHGNVESTCMSMDMSGRIDTTDKSFKPSESFCHLFKLPCVCQMRFSPSICQFYLYNHLQAKPSSFSLRALKILFF